MSNAKIYEIITAKMIERIEDAIKNKKEFKWVKPWKGYPLGNYLNYLKDGDNMREYRGINRILLDGGLYLTMKQIDELAKKDNAQYKVKKGSHAETVYFYKQNIVDKKDEDGNVMLDEDGNPLKTRYFLMRFYNVFNVDDVEGLEVNLGQTEKVSETELTKKADKLIKDFCKRTNLKFKVKKGSDKAYYMPALHEVTVPDKTQFKDINEYYSTVFHELTHSTSKDLNRELGGKFGSEKYSFEELIAELGSAFIMQSLGFETIKTEENSTAYLKGWLKQLKSDVSFIVKASNQAQKACDLFFNVQFEVNAEDKAA